MRSETDLAAPRGAYRRVLARVRVRRRRYDLVPAVAFAGAVLFSVAVWTAALWAIQVFG